MTQFTMFLGGCAAVCVITATVKILCKKDPKKAERVIDSIIFGLLFALLNYAVIVTDWEPVEEKLSKDLQEYRETQRRVWKY